MPAKGIAKKIFEHLERVLIFYQTVRGERNI